VFYYDVHAILMHIGDVIKHIPYTNLDKIRKIGFGGYGTVYRARYTNSASGRDMDIPKNVVLKRFKHFKQTPELFISFY